MISNICLNSEIIFTGNNHVVKKLDIFITDWYFHLFELITCFYQTYNVLHPVRKLNRLSEDKKRCFVSLVLFL